MSQSLKSWCEERLANHSAAALLDPLASSVRMLSIDLWDGLQSGEVTRAELGELARRISDEALVMRAERLRANSTTRDWSEVVASAYQSIAGQGFESIKDALEKTCAGIVFTAHPTFAMSGSLRNHLASMATSGGGEANIPPHTPDPQITLDAEHGYVLEAIDNAQESLRALIFASFDWLEARHPQQWTQVTPAPISLATWVGYDLDGRTDIHWAQSFRIRLEEKSRQLARYASFLNDAPCARSVVRELEAAAAVADEQARKFGEDLDDPENIVAAANALTASTDGRMTTLKPIVAMLNELIAKETDAQTKKLLCVARSEMNIYGLGVARIHLRVNAAQVRSALRADFGFAPGQEFLDRTALDAAASKSAGTAAQSINFGSVFQEKMTARRQMMLCAQFLKHVDSDTPIRFLIAEAEAPAMMMGAIYLAKLYGVDDRIDISPLFETPEAIERGGRFVERLLEEEEFVAYIKRRKRIAIQFGFSDSGRFMGQVAADMAIERLQILISRALAKKGVKDIEVVLFNTHGESMGRGGFPGGYADRFEHLLTGWTRARYEHDGLAVNAECSFQGGDGFVRFGTKQLSDAVCQALLNWSASPVAKAEDDRFYEDINFSWDVYRAIKGWQEALFSNENYQKVLSAFAPNLLPSTGSRKTRRQSGASKGDVARSLRAIPHNAILQQLAAPANVAGGIGSAATREPERFSQLIRSSARMSRLFDLAAQARNLTSLSILRCYASLYDPGFWTVRAARTGEKDRALASNQVADRLVHRSLDIALNRLANLLSVDRQAFDAASMHLPAAPETQQGFANSLYILHAIRVALIAEAFMLVAKTPSFSSRHELTQGDIIDVVLEFRFAEAAGLIAQIFPKSLDAPKEFQNLNEVAGPNNDPAGYPEIHEQIVDPLLEIDRLMVSIAVGVSHFYDAFG